MDTEIKLKDLRRAIDAAIDHLIEDLGIEKVTINEREDLYWDVSAPALYDTSKRPPTLETGRLTDDIGFVKPIQRGQNADVSYNLVHVAPLLRYIGEKVKR